MPAKTFWRCTVCGDIHFGVAGPKLCPTCNNENTYVKISKEEAKKIMSL
jgi:rubrerythrin